MNNKTRCWEIMSFHSSKAVTQAYWQDLWRAHVRRLSKAWQFRGAPHIQNSFIGPPLSEKWALHQSWPKIDGRRRTQEPRQWRGAKACQLAWLSATFPPCHPRFENFESTDLAFVQVHHGAIRGSHLSQVCHRKSPCPTSYLHLCGLESSQMRLKVPWSDSTFWNDLVFFFRPTPSWLPPGRPTRSIACCKIGLIS